MPSVLDWVTESLKHQLDAEGRYLLTSVTIPADSPVVSPARALDLAGAFVSSAASDAAIREFIKAHRGGEELNVANLVRSPRVEIALSPYETTPPQYGGATLRSRGSYYIVRFSEGGESVLSVAVAAHATDLILENGAIQYPRQSGNEFAFAAVRPGGLEEPISPELATRLAARSTGAKVDRVPSLLKPDWPYSVFYSRWRVDLDKVVRLRRVASAQIVETSTVYVGVDLTAAPLGEPTLLVPTINQPETQTVSSEIVLRIRQQTPVWFERVVFVP